MHHGLSLSELNTLIVGLVALAVGGFLTERLGLFKRLGLPVSVLGGVLAALVVALLRRTIGLEVEFATGTRDVLLLVFFTTVGLSAKFSSMKAGGRGLVILCGATVVLLVLQNLVGVGIALVRGAHPFYGLLIGSLSFIGGPGTAIAWSAEAQAMGLTRAPEIALGSATLATLAGALVAAPLTSRLIRRHRLKSTAAISDVPWVEETQSPRPSKTQEQKNTLVALLLLTTAVAIGASLNAWASAKHVLLPGFLTAMLGGVLIANLFDALKIDVALRPLERAGAISLQLFLALSLMGLQLWTIVDALGPLLLNVVIQVALSGLLALVILFRLLGRDYDAAVTAGGFMGFGLASMPVAFATMEEVTAHNGPSPRAFLLITLVASFFVDLANAAITKVFLYFFVG